MKVHFGNEISKKKMANKENCDWFFYTFIHTQTDVSVFSGSILFKKRINAKSKVN